jgi:hypothetical protein
MEKTSIREPIYPNAILPKINPKRQKKYEFLGEGATRGG